MVTFLGSHEYQLMEVSTLLRHTADPVAADLIQSLISLVSTLSTKPVYWESIQPSVRETLVVSGIIFTFSSEKVLDLLQNLTPLFLGWCLSVCIPYTITFERIDRLDWPLLHFSSVKN